MTQERPSEDPNIRVDDFVVTAVRGNNYQIGRVIEAGTPGRRKVIGTQADRDAALRQACELAGTEHRVFLYPDADSDAYCPIDCAKVLPN